MQTNRLLLILAPNTIYQHTINAKLTIETPALESKELPLVQLTISMTPNGSNVLPARMHARIVNMGEMCKRAHFTALLCAERAQTVESLYADCVCGCVRRVSCDKRAIQARTGGEEASQTRVRPSTLFLCHSSSECFPI